MCGEETYEVVSTGLPVVEERMEILAYRIISVEDGLL